MADNNRDIHYLRIYYRCIYTKGYNKTSVYTVHYLYNPDIKYCDVKIHTITQVKVVDLKHVYAQWLM